MTKCVICNTRPNLNGNGFCHNCEARIDKDRNSRKPQKAFRYVIFRDFVVGLYSSGDGTYKPRQVGSNPERLPKGITINLNTYCEGFTRSQIKKLKTGVLRACAV